jgi:hypothetical protein
MTETKISKIAKVTFITFLIIFIIKENSLYALNFIKALVLNNLLIIAAIIIIFLLWGTRMKGGNK